MTGILTINAGSSSLKVAAFEAESLEPLGRAEVAGLGHAASLTSLVNGERRTVPLVGVADHDAALATAAAWLEHRLGGIEWRAVGHRVTHGRDLPGPRIVDRALRRTLEALVPLAPLHQPHNLAGIAAAQRLAPGALQVACFDTSFHRTIPEVARRYALPHELSADGIEAYGFHGLSYEYIASILPDHLGARADARVIVAHLGSGASLCAMRGRTSIATTMGLTPLDGVPMGTLPGALDPGVLLYLLEVRQMAVAQVRDLLYARSGLLGVSGVSDSMKELLVSSDPRAAEAVALFVYRTACAIGALATALGGLDALVFTGGVGQRSPEIRASTVARLGFLGVAINDQRNENAKGDVEITGAGVR
jgi:acetate kinase